MNRIPCVSCLCVTENRPEFMPWLRWSFLRQTWPNKTLLIVDSSESEPNLEPHPAIRVIRMAKGTRVAEKRNRALNEVEGDFFAWFDDDDWQHPERLSRLIEAADDGAVVVGGSESWFLDLWGEKCAAYLAGPGLIFNGALFRTDKVRCQRFDEARTRAADTGWMRRIAEQSPKGLRQVSQLVPFFWLSHTTNLSNPRARRSYHTPIDELRDRIGPGAWLDTDAQLEQLRARLGRPRDPCSRRAQTVGSWPRIIGSWSHREGFVPGARMADPRTSQTRAPPDLERVSTTVDSVRVETAMASVAAMIKATVLDAPYLRTMVRHMLTQARVRFSERVVVVDPRPEFTGKYQSRPRGTRAELDVALSDLVNEGVVDRVIELTTDLTDIARIMSLYFGPEGARMPTHATSGGPIFPTLFGLEAVDSDHVVAMDADMFFHAASASWVNEGLALFEDPSTWLVMTHAGPPLGEMGSQRSLGRRNAARASWDPTWRVFQFKTASTRYFLTDRRRLRGKIPALWQGNQVLPLEQCISAGLRREGAYRRCLAIEGSWDLHAHFHGDPFPSWAPRIAELVEQGTVPRLQRGDYDLRLDRPVSRSQWEALIQQSRPVSATARLPSASACAVAAPSASACAVAASSSRSVGSPSHLPLSIVIAVRDRAGVRVNNMLASLAWQRPQRAAEVLLVSLGSQPNIDAELEVLCRRWGARFLPQGSPEEPWCKPLALNFGIRRTDASSRYVMTLDADMILAPNFLQIVDSELSSDPRNLVLCRISDLARITLLPSSPEVLLTTLPSLQRRTRLRGTHGSGAIQAASRDFFFEVRGYDEDLKWWGAEDGDMVQRAQRAGLGLRWIQDQTFMLHQWHPKRHIALADGAQRSAAKAAWVYNHRLVQERASVVRNLTQWGGPE